MEHDKVLGHGTGVQVLEWGKEGKGSKEPQQGSRRILVCFALFILTTEQPQPHS